MRRRYFFQPADLTAADLEQATYYIHVDHDDGHPVLHMRLPPDPRYPRLLRWYSLSRSERGLTWCPQQEVANKIEYDDYEVIEISREEAERIMARLREFVRDQS
jgi:hypothetical protein